MNIDFPPQSNGVYNNAGSSRQLANYLEHEDLERMQKGIYTEGFFNLAEDNLYKSQVILDIDKNIGQLLKTNAKFYAIHISPSEKELIMMGNTEEEQVEAMKRYIRKVIIPEYARNFNKGLSVEDIKFYGKIHFNRDRSDNKKNMHCHLIVSRKDQSNKVKISPLTNHRNTKKGAIKGGFVRVTFFENAEKGFDWLFGYNRQLAETFEYCNTMKNGSITDKLKMQEMEIVNTKQRTNVQMQQHTNVNAYVGSNRIIDFNTPVQQEIRAPVNQLTSQSNSFDNVGSLFSIIPTGADIGFDNNTAEDQQQQMLRKKKKWRRRTT